MNVCLDMDLEMPDDGRRLEMCKAVDDLKAMGRKEGRKEGIEEIAVNALRMRMKPDEVRKMTGLSESRIIQLAQNIGLEGNCGSTILR